MAVSGQTINNPLTKEQITFLKTSSDTHGRLLVFDCRVAPGGIRLPAHAHGEQEERFTILSGTLHVMVGDELHRLTPGQTIVLPAKIAHQWWNVGDEEVVFRVEVAPARNLEILLEAACGMALDGRLNQMGIPTNPFELANLARLSDIHVSGVPTWLQKIVLEIVSALGRWLGYDPDLRAYRAIAESNSTLPVVGSGIAA